jgi:hypothetical protein
MAGPEHGREQFTEQSISIASESTLLGAVERETAINYVNFPQLLFRAVQVE